MASLAEQYRPEGVEKAARTLWTTRGLPRPDGVVGRGSAPILHQYEGAFTAGDHPSLVVYRAVAADVAARYLSLAGRRAAGILHRDVDVTDDTIVSLLRSLSVWVGGEAGQPFDPGERRDHVEAILGRMAVRGLVVTRDAPLRICPHCRAPRSPERIVYAQEEGDTYLVRFPLEDGGRRVQALVWVDAPWRLLGATALLLNPEIPYVVARYRRKDVDELILTSRSSLARLVDWLPGAEVEVVEEHRGGHWSGHPYEYPLRAEFPMGSELTAPGGTIQAVADVGDSGTGIVPLVPGHGGTDAQIAERIGVTGWPLVTTRGQLANTLMHKYAGLDLATASEFVLRDLGEGGVIFAHLRVRRGVPYCAICGTSLVWAPGRAWCLEPSRLPAERRESYLRLLPRDPPMSQIEVASWPVSDSTTQPPGGGNATLLECPQCERLEPVGSEAPCSCGGARQPVTRPLLPSIRGILCAWARSDPFPAGDTAWIYLNERRRAPALTHHFAVMSGVVGAPADVGLTVLPAGSGPSMPDLVATHGADAVRCALVRGASAQPSGSRLGERCAQEARFLSQYWQAARDVLDRIDPALLSAFLPSVAGFLAELEAEDRAVLARWERVRVAALAALDTQAFGSAYRRLSRFLSNDLPRYRALVAPRLEPSAPVASRRGALRTLHHLVRGSALLLAPVAPHTAEVVYGAAQTSGTSLFEGSLEPVNATLIDEERARSWDRWQTVLEALAEFRRRFGVPASATLPSAVLIVGLEEVAQALRSDRPTLERLGRVARLEAFGPATPWTGRRRDLEPVLSEIQKVYPSEATQIVHILRRQAARRRDVGGTTGELSVVLQGTPRRILPSMVTYVERLPERLVPSSWRLGEMYVELAPAHPSPARVPPPLSPDGFCLVGRVEREMRQRRTEAGAPTPPLVVATLDPLATELRRVAIPLATYLGVPEVRVIDDFREFPLSETLRGRTKTGVRWWLHLPGLPPRRGPVKHRVARPTGSRVRPARPISEETETEFDYAGPEYIAREEQVRALMTELDGVLGAPLLGFAKTAGAWDAGLQSRAAFESASFDTLAALPGFGWPLAEALVVKFGGTPPARPPWRVQRDAHPPAPVDRDTPPLPARGGAGPTGTWPPEARAGVGKEATTPRVAVAPPPPPAAPTPARPAPLPAAHEAPSPPPADTSAGFGSPSPPPEVLPEPVAPALPGEPEPALPLPAPPPPPLSLEGPTLERLPPGDEIEGKESSPAAAPSSAEPAPPVAEREPPTPVERPSPETPPFTFEATDTEPGPIQTERPPLATPDAPETPPPGLAEARAAGGVDEGRAPSSVDGTLSEPPMSLHPPVEEPPYGSADETAPENPEVPPGPPAPPTEVASPEGEPREQGTDADGAALAGPAEEPFDGAADAILPVPEPREEPEEESADVPPGPPTPPPEVEAAPPGGPPAAPETESPSAPSTLPITLEPPVVPASPSPVSDERLPVLPFVPEVAAPPPPPPPVPVIPWGVQVIVSPSYLPPLREFLDMTAAGYRGVAIVRESPERLRTHVGPRPAEVYWLTNLGRGLTVKPNDLAAYALFLETAVERDRVTAFFLEGIEYLVRLHGIDRIVDLLTKFHGQAAAHEARVWVCVHPNLISPADLDRLVGAFARE